MTTCSEIEIDPMKPVTDHLSVSVSHTSITGLYSNHVKAFVQFVGRSQLKNGILWLKTGSCSASSKSGARS